MYNIFEQISLDFTLAEEAAEQTRALPQNSETLPRVSRCAAYTCFHVVGALACPSPTASASLRWGIE